MSPELKSKWIEALRSGKYKQGKNRLRSYEDFYCCLGVLCDVAGLEWKYKGYAVHGETMADEILPSSFREEIGFSQETENDLTEMNDTGKSFQRIANWIEKNL